MSQDSSPIADEIRKVFNGFPEKYVLQQKDFTLIGLISNDDFSSSYNLCDKVSNRLGNIVCKVFKDPNEILFVLQWCAKNFEKKLDNVIQYHGIALKWDCNAPELWLLMEKADSTFATIFNTKPTSFDEKWNDYLQQIVIGFASLRLLDEKARINCKPSNIYIFKNESIKIDGFDLTDIRAKSRVSSPGGVNPSLKYKSPLELNQTYDEDGKSNFSPKLSDEIYSIGALSHFLVFGKEPFSGCTPIAIYSSKLIDTLSKHKTLEDCPEHLIDFCKRCIAVDPENRPKTLNDVIALLTSLNASTVQTLALASDVSNMTTVPQTVHAIQ